MALIPITGFPSSNRVPANRAEILFAQGPASGATGVREVVICAPKLAGGTITAGELESIRNEATLITLAGEGSPAHRIGRIFLLANKTAKLHLLGVDGTSGGSPVAADATVTYATTATGTGSSKITISGEEIEFGINNGDTAIEIATSAVAAINARTWLPVTADNASGTVAVVTITAKLAGLSGGNGTDPTIRFRSEITTGIATTRTDSGAALGLGTGTPGVDGTTTEPVSLATSLAFLDSVRKYYMVFSANDATSLTNIETHISNKSEPSPGLRSVGIVAFNGTLADGQTLATGANYERLSLVWQPNSEHDPAELAGNFAAILQKRQEVDAAFNFDSYRQSDWLIKPAFSVGDWPDNADLVDAVNDGLLPISSNDSGSFVVISTTTRSKNAAGTVDDFRANEQHRISVADLFTDEMLQRADIIYENFKIANDPLNVDGTVDFNARLPPKTLTPHRARTPIEEQIDDYAFRGLLTNATESKESLTVVRDPNNSGRMEAGFDLRVIDLLHQNSYRVAEVSEG